MKIKLPLNILKFFSVFYLALPILMFFATWLKPVYSVISVGALLVALFLYFKNSKVNENEEFKLSSLTVFFIILFIWVAYSGAGGFGQQCFDYVKHNAVTKDLMEYSWPVKITVGNQQKNFSHYLGYYITGPFFFKEFGWKAIQIFNFFNTLIGISLAFFWTARSTKKISWLFLIFVVFGSGIQLFTLLNEHHLELLSVIKDKILNKGFVFWVNGLGILPLTYVSYADVLYWAPQHAIGCWLGVGLLLNDGEIDKSIKYAPFYLSLIAFWAPLDLVGIAPFLVYYIFKLNYKEVFNSVNLILAPIVFFFVSTYLLSINAKELIHHFIIHERTDFSMLNQTGAFFYFLLFEVFIWVIPVYVILKKHKKVVDIKLFYLTVILLVTIPLFRYGLYNDWAGRVSMAALLVLTFFIYKAFLLGDYKGKLILMVLLIFASLGPLIYYVSSFRAMGYSFKFKPPVYNEVNGIVKTSENMGYPIEQFIASDSTFFFKYLAKKND